MVLVVAGLDAVDEHRQHGRRAGDLERHTLVAAPCRQIALVLDPHLSEAAVDRAWGSGEPHVENPAALELRHCDGRVVDRLVLDGPLARLDARPLRRTPVGSVLVTVDLTALAGSTSGPLTDVIKVRGEHLKRAQALPLDGAPTAIRLPQPARQHGGAPRGGRDELLAVGCRSVEGGFVTRWRRFVATRTGWRVYEREGTRLLGGRSAVPAGEGFPGGQGNEPPWILRALLRLNSKIGCTSETLRKWGTSARAMSIAPGARGVL